jgi:HAD superfamily hydrolase (TIGR01509 family)
LRQTLQRKYPIADAFDLLIVSAEEGIMKPEPEIYQRTLTRLGRSAEETIFVDDSYPNVLAAQELGMQSIHFNARLDIPGEFAKYGVMVP